MEWREPPGRGRRRESPLTHEQVAEFKAHPGKWGIVRSFEKPTAASSAAGRLRKGDDPVIGDPKGWEFAAAKEGSGSVLFARWTG